MQKGGGKNQRKGREDVNLGPNKGLTGRRPGANFPGEEAAQEICEGKRAGTKPTVTAYYSSEYRT